MQTVEELICQKTGRNHCLLVGHGSTALFLALKLIGAQRGCGEVILPTVACASLAQVILYAGFEPVFADVTRENFTLDVRSFEAAITNKTRAVIPIHIFGHTAAMDEILRISAGRELFVIEDAAQSVGGRYQGRPHGSFGHFSILSFGGAKIIAAGAGGALLFDDDKYLASLSAELQQLPLLCLSEEQSLMALSQRNFYHALVDLLRVNPDADVSPLFHQTLPLYRGLYLHRFPENDEIRKRIVAGFVHLREKAALRVERALLYRDLLVSENVIHPGGGQESGVVWRYTFLVTDPDKLLNATREIRRHGIHASNHYWSVADLLYGDKTLSNTTYVCRRLLNLWVDDTATESYIRRSCEIILQSLAR